MTKNKDKQYFDEDLTEIIADQNEKIEEEIYRGDYKVDSRTKMNPNSHQQQNTNNREPSNAKGK